MRLVKGLLNRCLEAIELLAMDPKWRRLSDIAIQLDLQKGPAHRLLSEMSNLGWVEQDEATERYRLSIKLALLGQQYLRGTGLPGLVQPVLDEVAMKSCELVRLTLIQGGNMYWFASSQGASPGLMYQPSMNGRLVPHITANGKAWLVKAIAVVVRAFDDKRVVSTMSIAGPLMRMGPERDSEFSALLHHATNTLSMVWPHDEIPIVGEQ